MRYDTEWTMETGTANYISTCRRFRATYLRTVKGYAVYRVRRIAGSGAKSVLSTGGLPTVVVE